jgi:hypothetical protein
MPNSTLSAIRTKIRRLTRTPSANDITDAQIDEYINTFLLYDVPEHVRLFTFQKTLTFYTQPFVDTYTTKTNIADINDPLYQFKDRYITVNEPVFVAGYRTFFSQSRTQFYNWYPFINVTQQIGGGDGLTTTFTGTISSAPLLANNVLISSVDTTGVGIQLVDYPVSNTTGALGLVGVPQTLPSPYGQIDYTTGIFTANFPAAPGAGQLVNAKTVPYQPSMPQAVLYFNMEFTLRPVPDDIYPVNLEVYVRPTELLLNTQSPDLQEWWQYIAYGAAKKVFEDKMETESVAQIMPEFKQQERLILRRTIVQQTSERVATIYTENTSGTFGGGWWYGNPF